MVTYFKRFVYLSIIFSQIFLHASQTTTSMPRQATISTIQEALFNLRRIITNYPFKDPNTTQEYEQKNSPIIIKSARILCDNARKQILDTLQEIDNRLLYWQNQRDHPWRYIKSKFKSIIGDLDDAKIEKNIEQLESHKGELYVILGLLAQLVSAYDNGIKTTFVSDYTKGYAWVDELLDVLGRIKVTVDTNQISFIVRVVRLKLKLEKVRTFKNALLLEMADTQIPSHLVRNWHKYGALLFLLGQGYSHADQISNYVSQFLQGSKKYLISAQKSVTDTFFPGGNRPGFAQESFDVAKESVKNFINKLSLQTWWWPFGDITQEEKDRLLNNWDTINTAAELEKVADALSLRWYKKIKGLEATRLLAALEFQTMNKQSAGIFKLMFLTPALLSGWATYKGYKQFTTRDYTSIRRALIEINSLFVDQTKPLDDEQYGKMVYLLYRLKQQVEKVVPSNFRAEFLQDLERVESKEFDSAAKRRIIEDMFKKYSFLGLI